MSTRVRTDRPLPEQLIQLVWSLGTWNDHNWTAADYERWRAQAQSIAEAAAAEWADLAAENRRLRELIAE